MPNGTGLVLRPTLGYLGSNPTVTVSMAYELQYGDGMNFYQYLTSNPGNRSDPSGLITFAEILSTTTIQAGVGGMINGIIAKFDDYRHIHEGGATSVWDEDLLRTIRESLGRMKPNPDASLLALEQQQGRARVPQVVYAERWPEAFPLPVRFPRAQICRRHYTLEVAP